MRNRLTQELAICGVNAVLALGTYHPDQINRLFLREDRLTAFSRICKYLAGKNYPYKLCDDEELERLCKSSHHQGVVAMITEPEVQGATEEDLDLWAAEAKVGLILHSVGNDHNLGAMIRSAAFFDAHFVVLSGEDQEAKLSTSAYRVAEGGMEHVNIRGVQHTAAFLRAASKRIVTIGADPRARWRIRDLETIVEDRAAALAKRGGGRQAQPDQDNAAQATYRRPGIALVVGNEETGLPPEVKELCSALVRIPGTGNIESLNVAQAATLFLHEVFEL
ncbi:MAG: RNA methyltransferase [Treponema sp.]|jgi:TrmH RNA methyltransferase|nr:RNA methyltransferase [Treponema sp.]